MLDADAHEQLSLAIIYGERVVAGMSPERRRVWVSSDSSSTMEPASSFAHLYSVGMASASWAGVSTDGINILSGHVRTRRNGYDARKGP